MSSVSGQISQNITSAPQCLIQFADAANVIVGHIILLFCSPKALAANSKPLVALLTEIAQSDLNREAILFSKISVLGPTLTNHFR